LPQGSKIINRPPSPVKTYLIISGGLISLFTLVLVKQRQTKKQNRRLELEKAELDQLVKDRTASLNQANIILRQEIDERKRIEEALREANQTKDKLFSIIAHDLKNPFWGLINLTEMLSAEEHDFSESEIKELLQELHNQSKSAYNLLQELLTWSSIEQNRVQHSPQKVEISELIESCIQLITSNAKQKKINIENRFNGQIHATVDKFVLQTVINNLLGNAVKFTPSGEQIQIEAEQHPQHILIKVADSGVGIAPAHIDTLFSSKAGNSTRGTNNEAGTGLGLPLCKDLVEKAGGKIWAQAREGRGSVFSFTLPISQ
jgi:signal transduction histidine kinase